MKNNHSDQESEMTRYKELASRVGLGASQIAPRLFQMLADETDARNLL